MTEGKSCNTCSGAKKLIFSCSGAADVGEIADRAARRLSREGAGKMYCMAGIGARVSAIVKTTEAAGGLLALDGCPLNCASRSLAEAGFKNYASVSLADLGLDKGHSPASEENVEKVTKAAKELLTA
jgi:uncharacterized metal-binding protein